MKRQSCCSTHGPVVEQDEPGVQDLGIDQAETGPWVAGTNQLPASLQTARGAPRVSGAADRLWVSRGKDRLGWC
jgi:hypothetical protein